MKIKSFSDAAEDFRAAGLRRRHIYENDCGKNRELAEIRDEIKEAGIEKLQCVLKNEPEDGIDEKLRELAEREREVLKNISVSRYNCESCKDTGIVEGVYCPCFLETIYLDCYGAVDIGNIVESFDGFDISVFNGEDVLFCGRTQRQLAEYARKSAQKYIEDRKTCSCSESRGWARPTCCIAWQSWPGKRAWT